MQGDHWHRNYYVRHPHPDCCELCGAQRTEFKSSEEAYAALGPGWRRKYQVVVMNWDHCHEHNIVRGALCAECNTNEGDRLPPTTERTSA